MGLRYRERQYSGGKHREHLKTIVCLSQMFSFLERSRS